FVGSPPEQSPDGSLNQCRICKPYFYFPVAGCGSEIRIPSSPVPNSVALLSGCHPEAFHKPGVRSTRRQSFATYVAHHFPSGQCAVKQKHLFSYKNVVVVFCGTKVLINL